jgi:hypothetical protein
MQHHLPVSVQFILSIHPILCGLDGPFIIRRSLTEVSMVRVLCTGVIACWLLCSLALGGDAPSASPTTQSNADETKLPADVRAALERNTRELNALKEQYAKDIAEQKKRAEAQEKQIATLLETARKLEAQLNESRRPPAAEGGAQDQVEPKLLDVQQKQIKVLEEQVNLIADELEKQAPLIEKLEIQNANLESGAKRAAECDRDLVNVQDSLVEMLDQQQRNPPPLPPTLKESFLPSEPNTTTLSIYNTASTLYSLFPNHRGAGTFVFQEYQPFFLLQLNKRFLLSAQPGFTPGGVGLVQAQVDIFLKDWLTADVGYFLAPIGFWNERLDPVWINKLPDVPLVMRQVIPDGLTLSGLQFRGASYVAGSPIKVEYSAFMTNGLGVPGSGQAAAWYNLGGLIGTTANVNNAMAYGGRIGVWLPARGINFGVSDIVSAPYSKTAGAVVNIWQPYFNYHYGNWDVRFEYGNNFERTASFIGNNISREGLYAQVAYRDYQSMHKHMQRLEYVFRFSDSFFHGIDQTGINLKSYPTPMNAPLDRNQYTLGTNYYFSPSTVLKFAYEFNHELSRNINDNVFMVQFATNF